MYAFVFGPVAVTSEHFETVEPDGSHEFGTRLQVRRVNSDVVDAQRQAAGRDGLHTTIGDPIWRADLFGVVGGPPDNHAHAHYHPTFDGMQPCEREFAPGIVGDPIGWARGQLADVGALLTAGGAGALAQQLDQSEVDDAWPAIEASIRANFSGPRFRPDQLAMLSFTH